MNGRSAEGLGAGPSQENLPDTLTLLRERDSLLAQNEELRDLCCYLDDQRQCLVKTVTKWRIWYKNMGLDSKVEDNFPPVTKTKGFYNSCQKKQLATLKHQVEDVLRAQPVYPGRDTGSENRQTQNRAKLVLFISLIEAGLNMLSSNCDDVDQ